MIKGKMMDHIGLATNDVEADARWYVDVLGFEVAGKFVNNGDTVYFLQGKDVMYEMFPAHPLLPEGVRGKIDHFSFRSEDIEKDYAFCVEQGYKITTDGIEGIAAFWEKGVRFFKIESPTGEQIEFCQKV